MKKLKILLQSKFFLLFLFSLFVFRFASVLFISKQSSYSLEDTQIFGVVKDYSFKEDRLQLEILSKNEILTGFVPEEYNPFKIGIHDCVQIKGTLKELSKATNFYAFDFKDYAKRKKQYYKVDIEKIELVQKNKNIFYQIKNKMKNRIETFTSAPYLQAFLLGDTSNISSNVMESYRNNGVSHLLAVSGMHVSFLMGLLALIFQKIHLSVKRQLVIFSIFLSFYTFLVGFSPSVLRASLFFILLRCNKIYHWNKKPITILFFIFVFLLFMNPYYLWDVGFQYSFAISFTLVASTEHLKKKKNYLIGLLSTSYIAFLASILIGVFHFHQVQLFSIFYNLLFVPLVSFIIFPFSFIVFLFPAVEQIYLLFIQLLEGLSQFLNQISFSLWTMRHPNWFGIGYLFFASMISLVLFLKQKRSHIVIIFCTLLLYHNSFHFLPGEYLTMIDVGQGDSTLFVSNKKVMLIDTGGSIYKDIAETTIIPYLKAQGILKIDLLVLTHGDYDHLGSALSLLQNFPVQKVLLNANELNENEQKIIEKLKEKHIPYLKNGKKQFFVFGNFLISTFSLHASNEDENDSSIILYATNNKNTFLLMGDASHFSENEWMKEYPKEKVDILKVGHHGSKTSSSEAFLNSVKPKMALISAGRNNRFHHPSEEVVKRLQDDSIRIYSTILNGATTIDFRKNGNTISKIP